MIKYFKQQELLVITWQKKEKIVINVVKMKKFRQKILKLVQFEASLSQICRQYFIVIQIYVKTSLVIFYVLIQKNKKLDFCYR